MVTIVRTGDRCNDGSGTICGIGASLRQQRAAGEAKAAPRFEGVLLICGHSTCVARDPTMDTGAAEDNRDLRAALAG
jgi:hypothetical protein